MLTAADRHSEQQVRVPGIHASCHALSGVLAAFELPIKPPAPARSKKAVHMCDNAAGVVRLMSHMPALHPASRRHQAASDVSRAISGSYVLNRATRWPSYANDSMLNTT